MAEISRWFVVHTYSGYENKVATNIEKVVNNRKMQDLILEVNIPVETVVATVKKQITTVKVDKDGNSKNVTSFKLAAKEKNVTILSKDIDSYGVGTMVVGKADGSTVTLRVTGVSQEPNGEEITTVSYEREEEHKVFPGYVMVKTAVYENPETGEYEMTDDTWYVIRNTRGVTGFVGPESKPLPLSEKEVYEMGVEKRVTKLDYTVGDMVTIIDGAFEGIIGTVRELDVDKNAVSVEISLFGRATPVDLELDQVEKVEED